MSVVAAPVANAAAGTGVIEVKGATSLGICAVNKASDGTNVAHTAGSTIVENAAYGTIITVAAGVAFTAENHDAEKMIIKGAVLTVSDAGSGQTVTLNASGDRVHTSAATSVAATILPTAVGTGYLIAGKSDANAASTAANTIQINVVSSCGSDSFSAANSFVETITDYSGDSTVTTNVDTAVTAGAGTDLYIQIKAFNGYGVALSAGSFYVSATNNAKVSIGATLGSRPNTGDYSVATATTSTGIAVVRVARASAAVGQTTTVTITHNGTPVTTKTLTLLGEATSIKLVKMSSGTVGTTGASNTGYIRYQLLDASGAVVPGDISLDPLTATAKTPTFTVGKEATIAAGAVTNFASLGSITDGVEGFDCTSAGGIGTSPLRVTHTAAVTGATISLVVNAACAGGVATYSISTDKAAYKIGEIATITITAKDASGGAVSDATTMGAGQAVSAGGGNMVLAAADGDKFTGGVRTYQAQLTTAGTFNAVVNIPTGTVTKSATAAYTVSGGDVSNAEVLASIVKLIAAINKQIRALQKSLRR
jgi:hypothetical protein